MRGRFKLLAGAGRIAFGQPYPSAGTGRAGRERLAFEPCRRLRQALRLPLGPDRDCRPRPRSRPAPRGGAPGAAPCSAAAPSTGRSRDGREHPGWMRPRAPRSPAPDAPGRGPAAGPTRPRAPRGMPPPRPGCLLLRRRMRPSSVSGHPSSRRKYGRSSSQASERFLLRLRRTTRAGGGSRPGERGSVRGYSPRAAPAASAPSLPSTPRPGRIARALAAHTRLRNRRSRWRGDRAHRRPLPRLLR